MQDNATQQGKLLVQILGVHHLGTEYPKIVVTCLANGSTMSWTFVTLTGARNAFVSTPGGSASRVPLDPIGPPRLFLHVSDAVKNDDKTLGTAALDISGLLQPPHLAELWVQLQNAKKSGAAVQIRASFIAQPTSVAPPMTTTRPLSHPLSAPYEAPEPWRPETPASYTDSPSRFSGHVMPAPAFPVELAEQPARQSWFEAFFSPRPTITKERARAALEPVTLPPTDTGGGFFACCGANRFFSSCAGGPSVRDCARM